MTTNFRPIVLAACATLAALAVPTGAQAAHGRAYDAGVATYVHGYPPVVSELSQVAFPTNSIASVNTLTTPADHLVVMPNVDTAYSVTHLDLRAEPVIVHVPALAARYYVLQLMDAYTNVFGYIGTRTTGSAAQDVAIVGPTTAKAPPAGLKVIHSPTPEALLLGRTLVRSRSDLPVLHDLLAQYQATPLSAWAPGVAPAPSVVLSYNPNRTPPAIPTGAGFVKTYNQLLAANPPSAAEAASLKALRRYGVGAGVTAPDRSVTSAERAAFLRGVDAGPDHVDALKEQRRRSAARENAGWIPFSKELGRWGKDWDLRAIIATVGLFSNTPDEAVYPSAADDAQDRPLTGAHRYRLRFSTPPPTNAFWSLTMYGPKLQLYANPLKRYSLSDRSSGLKKGADGSLTILLQHDHPKGDITNWLPTPRGAFTVSLRMYMPKRSVLDGHWVPSGIACLDC